MSEFGLQRFCTWCGIVGVTLFFLGFVLSGFIPPPSPAWTQERVVAHYQTHATGIRTGMVIMMVSGMLIAPMIGVISEQMRRMRGVPRAMVYGQIAAGTMNAMFFIIPALLFVVTAFRPERNPEMTYLMNDMCWIVAVLPWSPAMMQSVLIGIAILADKSPEPVFPRWLSYLNFWVALAYVPGGFLAFFKQGLLAWNGLLVFWLAGTVFIIWFVVMTVMLFRAIGRQQRQLTAAAA